MADVIQGFSVGHAQLEGFTTAIADMSAAFAKLRDMTLTVSIPAMDADLVALYWGNPTIRDPYTDEVVDDDEAWHEVEFDLHWDLAEFGDEGIDQDVLQQFAKDGGEPWDIYAIETALFGAPLGQAA